MLANLTLTRPLVVLDCETTGLNTETSRIVELAFQVHKPDGEVDEWRSLINPGVPIPPRVTKVHGITDEDMVKCRVCAHSKDDHELSELITTGVPAIDRALTGCGEFHPIPRFDQIADKLARGFTDVDFAGKNVRFDLSILHAEFRRAKVEWSYAGAYIIDADRLEALAYPRDLTSLHKRYVGLPHDDAHAALSDVRATVTVIDAQLRQHEQLPRTLKELHDLSWAGWIDSEGKFRHHDGEPTVMFGKHRYEPMREVPKDYWQYMIRGDFSAEAKRYAAEALAGRFP